MTMPNEPSESGKPPTGFPEPPGEDPEDRTGDQDPHHVLNNPASDPDPTEWPDPYDKRPDPRDPPNPADDLRDLPDPSLPPGGGGPEGRHRADPVRQPVPARPRLRREPQRARGRPALAVGRRAPRDARRGRRRHRRAVRRRRRRHGQLSRQVLRHRIRPAVGPPRRARS